MSTTSVSRQQQITSAQERLLALLEGPRAHVDTPPLTDLQACPKCGTPEFKTDMWCGSCGYCPKAGFDGSPLEDDSPEELDVWRIVPGWMWLMLGVEVALIVGSIVFSWAIGGHYARTLVSLSLLGLGSLLAMVSHFRAYFSTLSTTHCQGTLDIIMKPSTIWREVARRLPNTSRLFCSIFWGTTCMLMSVFVIGGLDCMSIRHFATHDKPSSAPTVADVAGTVVKGGTAVRKEGNHGDRRPVDDLQGTAPDAESTENGSPKDIDEAVTQFAGAPPMEDSTGTADDDGATPESENSPQALATGGESTEAAPAAGDSSESQDSESDSDAVNDDESDDVDEAEVEVFADESQSFVASLPAGDVVTCAIVGFTVNSAGEPRSLLLAAPAAGGWHYVARLSIEEIPADVMADLTSRFPEHLSSRPLVDCPFGGQWLTLDFFCDIHFPNSPTGPRLGEPTFVEMQSAP